MATPSVHILLVDDDADDRMLFKEAAGELGIPVKISELVDGSAVIPALEAFHEIPDIIVMDINMPGINGMEALSLIRQHPRFKDMPVVLMTTSADPAMIFEGQSRNADRYVIKPAEFKDLKRIVIVIAREWQTFRTKHASKDFILNKILVNNKNADSIL